MAEHREMSGRRMMADSLARHGIEGTVRHQFLRAQWKISPAEQPADRPARYAWNARGARLGASAVSRAAYDLARRLRHAALDHSGPGRFAIEPTALPTDPVVQHEAAVLLPDAACTRDGGRPCAPK
ncbi:hypothetical protein JW613_22050 [Streptomyces smyrnaeus]|uniref:Transposase n=1 Tax=Streptomyces smyrnaeus TaxID=1387713 RepID=A0ABS3Y096_9ACTN|nr:hypothetical protein [Streptomyces smyrnaeus]MBO8200963.1 hypothetical protein [Streptomyces smyrnaeus]